ncbi:MAG TPA: hypothetical protein V6C81_26780 [Planktothrix sp.]|jgi:hypothetical protein
MAPNSGFRTPGQITGDVNRRDRAWEDWERTLTQTVVTQMNEALQKNYPGSGWLRVRLRLETYSGGHDHTVYNAMTSAFDDKMKPLCEALSNVFAGAQWRCVAKLDGSQLVGNFQPLAAKTRWFERWFGWIGAVAHVDEKFNCTKVPAPPATVRPNMREAKGNIDGISIGQSESSAPKEAFAYDNLC